MKAMKTATIYKRSRVEIEETISDLEKKVQKANDNKERLTHFNEYCLKSHIKSIEKMKIWLEETNEEWIYTFRDVVVNNQLPEIMKF